MRHSGTFCRLVLGTSAFPAYMIGLSVSRRAKWMERARKAKQSERAMYVRFAREANHELLADFKDFRKRNPEARQ